MALRMKLEPTTPAQPGSYRNGCIIFRPTPGTAFDVDLFTVTLLGVSKTHMVIDSGPDKDIHENSVTFLEIKKEIYRGPMILESGHVAHFFFDFLRILRPNTGTPSTPFSLLPPHLIDKPEPQALPPSGKFGSGSIITYNFQASLTDKNSHSEIRATYPIGFTKTREAETPDPQIITSIQELLIANQETTADQSGLKLALDSPMVIVQEQTFPLKLRLLQDEPHSTPFPPPTVLLRHILVQILETTLIQSDRDTEEHCMNKHAITSRDFFSDDPNTGALNITREGLNMGPLLEDLKIGLELVPSFESPNIQRLYGLAVSLMVVCGGKTYILAFDLSLVTVLGAETSSMVRTRECADAWDRDPDQAPRNIRAMCIRRS